MAFREVSVTEIREVLRLWVLGEGLRSIERLVSCDRKTVRRYVQAAEAAGLTREGGQGQLSDELIGAVVETVRPARPRGRGVAWQRCEAEREAIARWLREAVPVVSRSGASDQPSVLHLRGAAMEPLSFASSTLPGRCAVGSSRLRGRRRARRRRGCVRRRRGWSDVSRLGTATGSRDQAGEEVQGSRSPRRLTRADSRSVFRRSSRGCMIVATR